MRKPRRAGSSGFGDRDGDGFVEYAKVSDTGLVNQGWKDSWDAVTHADGSLAPPPIALCEVQGYVYAAYKEISYLAKRLGEPEQAAEWESKAEQLRSELPRAILVGGRAGILSGAGWPEAAMPGRQLKCWAMSLDGNRASRMGRVGGIPAYGRRYVHWLGDTNALKYRGYRYNPMSYHNGSVWPHDTALIGAGFASSGDRRGWTPARQSFRRQPLLFGLSSARAVSVALPGPAVMAQLVTLWPARPNPGRRGPRFCS